VDFRTHSPKARETEISGPGTEADVITIALLVATILLIAIVIAVAMLRAGIAREESDKSLRGAPETLASTLTRRMVGLYVRMPPRPGARTTGADDTSDQKRSGHPWPGNGPR
jgi:hypothetical protein